MREMLITSSAISLGFQDSLPKKSINSIPPMNVKIKPRKNMQPIASPPFHRQSKNATYCECAFPCFKPQTNYGLKYGGEADYARLPLF
ncbi:MAG: hypothetical protein COX90_04355 [Candidatus Nealsonbacteria bacterium CG_4_10_14_0_2_um_filter_38_17]|uniref:Uncharacterized protein n=2 Tax=Candidatus Nealsoniibacteriota TaxID=1817911 RepID=A0A2M7UWY8_9BACT|nr:MAG: hypothetical protein COX90_04355 [Candidatus Nealsonbacteria bacterium CG_4_10_14_0_2_um_filter_38_17]